MKLLFLVAFLLYGVNSLILDSQNVKKCPKSHPFAFENGKKCCTRKGTERKHYCKEEEYDCADGKETQCPYEFCDDFYPTCNVFDFDNLRYVKEDDKQDFNSSNYSFEMYFEMDDVDLSFKATDDNNQGQLFNNRFVLFPKALKDTKNNYKVWWDYTSRQWFIGETIGNTQDFLMKLEQDRKCPFFHQAHCGDMIEGFRTWTDQDGKVMVEDPEDALALKYDGETGERQNGIKLNRPSATGKMSSAVVTVHQKLPEYTRVFVDFDECFEDCTGEPNCNYNKCDDF